MTRICTTIEQSRKLIELGLDRSTADFCYVDGEDCAIKDGALEEDDVPAWSLSKLMELLPSQFVCVGKYGVFTYKVDIRKYKLTDDVDLYQIAYGNYKTNDGFQWKDMVNTGEREELVDAAFDMICWLIKNKDLIEKENLRLFKKEDNGSKKILHND